jgi:hypothetical protein
MMAFTRPLLYLYDYKLSDQRHGAERTVSHPSYAAPFFSICALLLSFNARRGRIRRRILLCPIPSSPCHDAQVSNDSPDAPHPLYPSTIHCYSFHFFPHRHRLLTQFKCYISVHKTVKTKNKKYLKLVSANSISRSRLFARATAHVWKVTQPTDGSRAGQPSALL